MGNEFRPTADFHVDPSLQPYVKKTRHSKTLKRFTQEQDDELLARRNRGESYETIAIGMNRGRTSVRVRLRHLMELAERRGREE